MKLFYSSARATIGLAFLVGLSSYSCSNLKTLEDRFAADPKLSEESSEANSPARNDTKQNKSVNLPEDFPAEIPQFPDAKLISANPTAGKTFWQTAGNEASIVSFYEDKLESNNWQILKSFASDAPENSPRSIIASFDDLEITIAIEPNKSENKTDFSIAYRRNNTVANPPRTEISPPTVNPEREKSQMPTVVSYTDLDKVPTQLRPYVKEVIALGSIVNSEGDRATNVLFEPNKVITRREYARWLVSTNNAIYSHRPSQAIRLATSTQDPVFKDIATLDADFAYIQGLAQAGIIPSALTGDSSEILFRPDAPLTREDFIAWKVPLDIRRSLPTASIAAIQETWGFEDSARIDSTALRSLYADFQNGENSNVRRVFGYIVLFQPKKTVTRAEAVASFWYFGYQGDGISAEEALKIRN